MVFAISGKPPRGSVHFIFIAFSSPIGAVLKKHSNLDVLASPFNPPTEGFLRYFVKYKVIIVFCLFYFWFFVYLFVCFFFSGGGRTRAVLHFEAVSFYYPKFPQ